MNRHKAVQRYISPVTCQNIHQSGFPGSRRPHDANQLSAVESSRQTLEERFVTWQRGKKLLFIKLLLIWFVLINYFQTFYSKVDVFFFYWKIWQIILKYSLHIHQSQRSITVIFHFHGGKDWQADKTRKLLAKKREELWTISNFIWLKFIW